MTTAAAASSKFCVPAFHVSGISASAIPTAAACHIALVYTLNSRKATSPSSTYHDCDTWAACAASAAACSIVSGAACSTAATKTPEIKSCTS